MPDVRQETGGCKTEDLFQKGIGAGCGAVHKPGGCTVEELNRLGPEGIPEEYVTSSHLVYNSPATLAYNSPGAEGFGVKRAGLAVPGSIMLIVSPGCCGRNTAEITKIKGYEERFFYLEIGETDLVTGRHLKVIPQAVAEIVESCRVQPSLVMICITCVDALLGTDARKAETLVQIPVRPCYMYALTREGRRPPMVAVRQSLYSLLPSQKRIRSSVNLLGFFAPVDPDCELFGMLRGIGVKTIRQISTCENIGEFYRMGEANFNLVLNPEAQDAADDLSRRLGIPSVALTRFYGADRIARQYRALSAALGVKWSCGEGRQEAEEALASLKRRYPKLVFSIGEVVNANPFELALALSETGFCVREIFANPAPEYAWYIGRLAERSPQTMVYSNMEPTMIYYDIAEGGELPYAVAVGKDAGYYHPDAAFVPWNTDEQPFGYAGLRRLADAILSSCEERYG